MSAENETRLVLVLSPSGVGVACPLVSGGVGSSETKVGKGAGNWKK